MCEIKFRAYRKDTKEYGDVLFIDFEKNYALIRFFTEDKKYYYEKSYKLNDEDLIIEQCEKWILEEEK